MQLVINAGSSSLKWSLFRTIQAQSPILSGVFERIGDNCVFVVNDNRTPVSISSHADAISLLANWLAEYAIASQSQITSCVHRVVHGGEKFKEPVIVDRHVRKHIDSLSMLAPLHNPVNLACIDACSELFTDAKQVAVFDTAFHHTIPEHVYKYALPNTLYQEFGVRKYGFHGINHSYVSAYLTARYGEPVDAISCHLGSGSSITALKEGLSVDTTMGFTPLDGLLMSTRCGEIDPEIPLFLMREKNMSVDEVEQLLTKESGLLGLTGHSDMRDVYQAAQNDDEKSMLALEMLSYRVAFFINAMRTAVSHPKAIVFTGGIGQKAWYVRKRVCELLDIKLDKQANKANETRVSDPSFVDVLVIKADEETHMHMLAYDVLEHN